MDVGQRLEYFRSKAEHTQQSLAAETGVSRETVVSIENGRSSPTVATLAALLKGCGVTLGDFFLETSPRKISSEHSELHNKLQEILEGDPKGAQGITVNLDYIHGHMLALMQEEAAATRKNGKQQTKEPKNRQFG